MLLERYYSVVVIATFLYAIANVVEAAHKNNREKDVIDTDIVWAQIARDIENQHILDWREATTTDHDEWSQLFQRQEENYERLPSSPSVRADDVNTPVQNAAGHRDTVHTPLLAFEPVLTDDDEVIDVPRFDFFSVLRRSRSRESTPRSTQSGRSLSRRGRPALGRRRTTQDSRQGDDKVHICHECGDSFNRSEHLRRHYRSLHTDEKPFQCRFCNSRHSRSDNLAQHERSVHKSESK